MTEPASATSVGLVAFAVAIVGPLAGPYAVIVLAALAGSLWPLENAPSKDINGAPVPKLRSAMLVLRLVATSSVLTGVVAGLVGDQWSIPTTSLIAPVAFGIALLGDRWKTIGDTLFARLASFVNGGTKP